MRSRDDLVLSEEAVMRLLLVGIVCAVVAWVVWTNSSPGLVSANPSPQLRTFAQTVADRDALESAKRTGRLHEAPARRELRQAVLRAANRLENSPCDAAVRLAFRKAVVSLIAHLRDTDDAAPETYAINGRVVDTTGFLNSEASDVIEQAAFAGVLRDGDIMGKPAAPDTERKQPDTAERSGRYVCQRG
jgi:hypothetical protein